MSNVTVTLDGLTFSSSPDALWKLSSIQGWYDGPTVRNNNLVERPTGDGYFNPGKVYRQGRAITLSGFVTSPDSFTAQSDDWAALAAFDTEGNGMVLSVTDDAGTKTATVWLAGSPTLSQIGPNRTQFTVQLVAPDPVRYGDVQPYVTDLPSAGGGLEYNLGVGSSGALYYGSLGLLGRVNIMNEGTAAAYPAIRVNGDLPSGFSINVIETNERITYPRTLNQGDYIAFNMRTGKASINGQSDVTKYLTDDDFFSVPARTVRTVQFNSLGGTSFYDPTMVVSFSPGYW